MRRPNGRNRLLIAVAFALVLGAVSQKVAASRIVKNQKKFAAQIDKIRTDKLRVQSAAPWIGGTTGPNVILVMVDGVRWKEVFNGTDPALGHGTVLPTFPFLKGTLGQLGFFAGDKFKGYPGLVANPRLNSLPGYQSIMAGAVQPCGGNSCGRIDVETFEERLVREAGFAKNEVATIASWNTIANAVEHEAGATFVNAGRHELEDPDAGETEAELQKLNKLQEEDTPPWGKARWDKYTFAHAMRYLKVHRPRFLFISLNDSDEWGHKNEYDRHIATLELYDQWLHDLVSALNEMGDYGKRTTLLVTTDHGRGDGDEWKEHGSGYPLSRDIWLYGQGPQTRAKGAQLLLHKSKADLRYISTYSHLDIRPTVETILGLEPKLGSGGRVISELAPTQGKPVR